MEVSQLSFVAAVDLARGVIPAGSFNDLPVDWREDSLRVWPSRHRKRVCFSGVGAEQKIIRLLQSEDTPALMRIAIVEYYVHEKDIMEVVKTIAEMTAEIVNPHDVLLSLDIACEMSAKSMIS